MPRRVEIVVDACLAPAWDRLYPNQPDGPVTWIETIDEGYIAGRNGDVSVYSSWIVGAHIKVELYPSRNVLDRRRAPGKIPEPA